MDGPNDIDMVTRTHEAVQAFTCIEEGVGDYINLLDALVDPDYEVMDEDEVYNAVFVSSQSARQDLEEPYNNFLAIREPDDDILVLVSNDGQFWIPEEPIVFPDTDSDYQGYGSPEILIGDGFDVDGCYCSKNDPQGYYLHPQSTNLGFALIRIPASGTDRQGQNSSAVVEQTISLTVSRNTGPSVLVQSQGADACIYDLTGRVVEKISRGETIEFSSCIHPAGVYFAVLSEENTPLYIEKLVLLDGGR